MLYLAWVVEEGSVLGEDVYAGLSGVLLVVSAREPQERREGLAAGIRPDGVGEPPAELLGVAGGEHSPERPVEVPLSGG